MTTRERQGEVVPVSGRPSVRPPAGSCDPRGPNPPPATPPAREPNHDGGRPSRIDRLTVQNTSTPQPPNPPTPPPPPLSLTPPTPSLRPRRPVPREQTPLDRARPRRLPPHVVAVGPHLRVEDAIHTRPGVVARVLAEERVP